MNDSFRLIPWYLNTRRLSVVTNQDIGSDAQISLNHNSGERAQGMFRASQIANAIVASGNVPTLTREVIKRGIPDGRVLASLWTTFVFRGVSKALVGEQRAGKFVPASFSASLPLGEDDFSLTGTLSLDHLYSQSSVRLLSGRKRAFMLGQFDFQGKTIVAEPYIIGDFATDLSGMFTIRAGPANSRIYPAQIDAFANLDSVRPPSDAALKELRQIPESKVKDAFAELVGEPFVPKDWGGEKSDLYTSRLTIQDKPISTAFIFKGPAVRGPMHPADLGRRGDQLIRAFDEPAELIVVQHCDQIATSVIRQAEALSADPAKPRRYCIIDGADTFRILKAYGKL
jgi:hypothetical protein